MARLKLVSPALAPGKAKDVFTSIEQRLDVVPAMMQTMANSPAFVKGYLSWGDALATGTIGSWVSELIALTVTRQASVTDPEISEIIGHIALNVLTNYFNIVAKTEICFPIVTSRIAAVA